MKENPVTIGAAREILYSAAESAFAARQILFKDVRYPIEARADRVRRSAFPKLQVAVVGPFSAGKSTFINAFIGKLVRKKQGQGWEYKGPLGEGRLPTTRLPTQVSCVAPGEKEHYIAVHLDGREEILTLRDATYLAAMQDPSTISDHINEAIRRRVKDLASLRYVLALPARLDGIEIVDTPGLDSVFEEHTFLAEQAIRESNAVFYLLDEHISAADKYTLINVKDYLDHVIFIQTQCDLQRDEKAVAELVASSAAAIAHWLEINPPSIVALSAWSEAAALAELGRSGADEFYTTGFRELQVRFDALSQQHRKRKVKDAQRVAYVELTQVYDDVRAARRQLEETKQSDTSGRELLERFCESETKVAKAIAALEGECAARSTKLLDGRIEAWVVRIKTQVEPSRSGWNAAENTGLHIQRAARLLYDEELKDDLEKLLRHASGDVSRILESNFNTRLPAFALPPLEPRLAAPIMKAGIIGKFLSWLGRRIPDDQIDAGARRSTENIFSEVRRLCDEHVARLSESVRLQTQIEKERAERLSRDHAMRAKEAEQKRVTRSADLRHLEETISDKLAGLTNALTDR